MFVGEEWLRNRVCSTLPVGSNCLRLGYGRFLQADPLGYDDGLDWYNYVGGDPVNATDPSGMLSVCDSAVCVFGSSGGVGFVGGGLGSIPGVQLSGLGLGSLRDKDGDGEYDIIVKAKATPKGSKSSNAAVATPAMPPNSHQFTVPDDGSGDIIVTAPNQIPDSAKYVLAGGKYYRNPHYVDPIPWLNLENFMIAQVAVGSFAAGPGLPALTARGTGLLNSNNFLRLGYNWRGTARAGEQVYRIGIGKKWVHIDLLP